MWLVEIKASANYYYYKKRVLLELTGLQQNATRGDARSDDAGYQWQPDSAHPDLRATRHPDVHPVCHPQHPRHSPCLCARQGTVSVYKDRVC